MKTQKSIFCLANSRERADRIVAHLKSAYFQPDTISALFADEESSRAFAHDEHTKISDGAMMGASAGGLISGALGWIAGVGVLAIPGVGPFIAAGPITAMLSGPAPGATAGGLVGTLIGMGIPEREARCYESRLINGCILISVHADTYEEIEDAEDIFAGWGGEHIYVASFGSRGY